MTTVDDVKAITVTLQAEKKTILFVVLDDSGSINRQGSARSGNTYWRLHIGRTNEPLFDELKGHLTKDMLALEGGYRVTEERGVPCVLTVTWTGGGFAIAYGSESGGLPRDVGEFVRQAETLTDPWYAEQREFIKQIEERGPTRMKNPPSSAS